MLISPKRLKVRTSNLAGVFPGIVPTWPLTNVSKKWAWSRSRDPVHFGALNANSFKTAKGTNFKFDRHVPGIVATWPLTKVSETLACGQGHVTETTVPCKLQQWDRYRVPQNTLCRCQFGVKWGKIGDIIKCSYLKNSVFGALFSPTFLIILSRVI